METTKLLIGLGIGAGVLYLMQRTPAPGQATRIQKRVMSYSGTMWEAGQRHGVEPAILAAIMQVESGGNPNAIGRALEAGLMQIAPATAGDYCTPAAGGSIYLKNPTTNINCGAKIFAAYLKIFNAVAPTVSAYNAGPGNVSYDAATGRSNVVNRRYVLDVIALIPVYRALFHQRYKRYYTLKFPPNVWNLRVNLAGGGFDF